MAAIDCGTNSIRLLVARLESGQDAGAGAPRLVDLHREMRVVRLGEGVDATGRLSEAAMARTFAATEDYAALIRQFGAESVRFVATSASRDAANAAEFTAGIRDRLGVEPEVVSGEEEAALSFAGAASVLASRFADETDGQRPGPVLVVDLGGGSTEFVLGTLRAEITSELRPHSARAESDRADSDRTESDRADRGQPAGGQGGGSGPVVTHAVSVPMGCVRFSERHLHSDPPSDAEIEAAVQEIEAVLDEVEASVPLGEAAAVVGVAGSVTTVTAAALELSAYEPDTIHGTELDVDVIADTASRLLAATRAQRAALPYMHPGRADVIGAGALIWSMIVRRVAQSGGGRVTTATTSEHDILDGIALSQAG
ncbi:Ppx/GppA phosphatase family protein [Microbacterium sp. A93]|uniref:Ppx/GppA phosphatase family protein n=1 Tax=Microbacterium sp. A93 TaxID=3450716 RepID=UPI003F43FF1B